MQQLQRQLQRQQHSQHRGEQRVNHPYGSHQLIRQPGVHCDPLCERVLTCPPPLLLKHLIFKH